MTGSAVPDEAAPLTTSRRLVVRTPTNP